MIRERAVDVILPASPDAPIPVNVVVPLLPNEAIPFDVIVTECPDVQEGVEVCQ